MLKMRQSQLLKWTKFSPTKAKIDLLISLPLATAHASAIKFRGIYNKVSADSYTVSSYG